METLIEALRMAEKDKDDYLAMFITVDLASAYLARENEVQAIDCLEGIEKYSLEDKGQEYEMKAYAKQNLAYVYYNKQDYEKAYQYAVESRQYIEQEGDDLIKQDDMLVNDVLMADILINQGKYDEGKKLLDNAKEKYENSVKFSYVGFEHNINMTYGFYYRSIGDNDKALEYYLKIDKDFAGNELGTYDYAYLCYIYEIYEEIGDYENAYKYLLKASENMGASYALAMDEQASYLLGEFQNEKKVQEIDYLKRKNSNATILLIFVAFVFIVILVGIRIIYNKNKELGKINEKLKDLSEVDALTGLSNRRSLEEFLSTDWNKMVRNQFPISVAMMDVDFFKLYNDNYGHQMGDVVLQSVGGYLEKHKRVHDFAARYGGEEFILIMPNTDEELAAKLTETIRKSIFELGIEHKYSKVSDRVSLSIGVATLKNKEYTRYDDLIHKADSALYEAKKTRNCVSQYKEDQTDKQ